MVPLLVSVPPFGYLMCFKPDFDTIKRRVDLFNEYIKTSCYMLPLQCSFPLDVLPPSVCVTPFGYIRGFKTDINTVQRQSDLFNE